MTHRRQDQLGTIDVRRDDAARRYEAAVDGLIGFAVFERDGDTITFPHTLVPPELEGRGVGSAIVRYALDDARVNRWQVVPSCPFFRAYIGEHPEYEPLVRSTV